MHSPAAKHNSAEMAKLQRLAGYASLSVASILIIAKFWAWVSTDSVSILSSLVDSFLDMLASSITVIAIYFSLMPADSEHRFGHGKSEGLAALMQAIIVTTSAIYVFKEAVLRILEPQPVQNPAGGIAVMALSIALTFALLTFQKHVTKVTGSIAIAADSVHYRSDLLINLSVVVAVFVTGWINLPLLDPLVGIGIGCYIVWNTYEIAVGALDVLLDRELPEEERNRIYEIAVAHPKVLGFHDLRTRSSGSKLFIQFHLELDPDTPLLRAHKILDEVEDSVRNAYPRCEIIVHPDPLGFEEMRDGFEPYESQ
jgi:ferrous-iron efflux pump FieF